MEIGIDASRLQHFVGGAGKRLGMTLDLTAWQEAQAIWGMAWKVSLATFCRLALSTISTAFVGHLGKTELAAASLAGIWVNSTQVVIFGFAISLCTLCGQAYGAKNYELCGMWLQLGLVCLTVCCVPICVSFFYVETILSHIVSDPEILALASTYARVSCLSVWPQCAYCALRQYLQAQEIIWPGTVVAGTSIFVSFGANYVLIYGVAGLGGYGFVGAPLAQSVGYLYQLVALWYVACGWKQYHRKTWYGWSLECFQFSRLRRFCALSFGITINLCLDEWVYSAVTAMAGLLGSLDVAANAILFNLWGLLFAVFWGFGLPTQVRCANQLGANQPNLAKRTMMIGFGLGACSAFLASCLVLMFAPNLAQLFTTNVELANLVVQTMPIFSTAVFMSALHLILASVVEAMGLATILVVVTGFGSWGVILPASYVLAIPYHYRLVGIWTGSVLGELTKFIAIVVVLCRVNWDNMARQAVRLSEGSIQDSTLRLTPAITRPSPIFMTFTPQ